MTAESSGQDVPFFEVRKNMFDDDSAASEAGVARSLRVAQRAVFRPFLG